MFVKVTRLVLPQAVSPECVSGQISCSPGPTVDNVMCAFVVCQVHKVSVAAYISGQISRMNGRECYVRCR